MHCKEDVPLNQFGKYRGYTRKYCNGCRSLKYQISKECQRNRTISYLINGTPADWKPQ
jgi:hypothetical protein